MLMNSLNRPEQVQVLAWKWRNRMQTPSKQKWEAVTKVNDLTFWFGSIAFMLADCESEVTIENCK